MLRVFITMFAGAPAEQQSQHESEHRQPAQHRPAAPGARQEVGR